MDCFRIKKVNHYGANPGYGSRNSGTKKIYKIPGGIISIWNAYFVYRDTGEVKYFRGYGGCTDRHPTINFYGEFLDGPLG